MTIHRIPVGRSFKHMQRLLSEVGAQHGVALRLEYTLPEPGLRTRKYRVRLHFDDSGRTLLLSDWLGTSAIRVWVKSFYFGAMLGKVIDARRLPVDVS